MSEEILNDARYLSLVDEIEKEYREIMNDLISKWNESQKEIKNAKSEISKIGPIQDKVDLLKTDFLKAIKSKKNTILTNAINTEIEIVSKIISKLPDTFSGDDLENLRSTLISYTDNLKKPVWLGDD